jgi:hypothetical protein
MRPIPNANANDLQLERSAVACDESRRARIAAIVVALAASCRCYRRRNVTPI